MQFFKKFDGNIQAVLHYDHGQRTNVDKELETIKVVESEWNSAKKYVLNTL